MVPLADLGRLVGFKMRAETDVLRAGFGDHAADIASCGIFVYEKGGFLDTVKVRHAAPLSGEMN
jgi:hypothetical protein